MKWTILCAMAASAALAASAAIPPAYLGDLPPEHHAGVVDYITGGTTRAEADSIKRAAQAYPLELVFQEQVAGDSAHVQNVPVTITDAHGKAVFVGVAQGPYFIARLPTGEYTVTTAWDSWTFSKPVTIAPGERERVVFDWKKDASEPVG